MNKKILIITLIAVLTLGLTACNSEEKKLEKEAKQNEETMMTVNDIGEEVKKEIEESKKFEQIEAVYFSPQSTDVVNASVTVKTGTTKEQAEEIANYVTEEFSKKINSSKVKMPENWQMLLSVKDSSSNEELYLSPNGETETK